MRTKRGWLLRALDPTEEEIHRTVAQWVVLHEARYPLLKLMFHPANGAHKTPAQRGIFKALLQRSGVPDLMWPVRTSIYNGLALELKSVGGRISIKQADYLAGLALQGWKAVVCRSAGEAIDVIQGYRDELLEGAKPITWEGDPIAPSQRNRVTVEQLNGARNPTAKAAS